MNKDFFERALKKIWKEPQPENEHLREIIDDQHAAQKNKRQVVIVVLAVVIGVLAGYGAIVFRQLLQLSHFSFFASDSYIVSSLYNLPWWKRLFSPAIGGALVGIIIWKFAPEVKGGGIPDVMESVALKGGLIRFRVLFAKVVAAAITIGSGGSAGREGPIVHIGSSIGSAIGRLVGVSAKHMRTFVACGASAGIAATFNAPIAGALFSLEVILGEMKVVSMSPIVISSVIATVISRHYLGDSPAFIMPAYEMVSYGELLLYALMGIVAALVGVLFIKLYTRTTMFFENLTIHPVLKPMIGGLMVGLIGVALPHVFGVGYETINDALWGRTETILLLIIIVAKMFATSFSLGSGGCGGTFAPSLFMGGALGASFGQFAQMLFPGWTASPGAYALVGMGAMVAGITQAPISAILIIFELTNNYQIIAPLMICCVIAVLLSTYLSNVSIYTAKLINKGVDMSSRKEVNLLRSIKVRDVMKKRPSTISADVTFASIIAKVLGDRFPYTIVQNKSGKYIGTIELNDIRELLPQKETISDIVVAADVAKTDMPYVFVDDNLDLVMHIFGRTHRDYIAVCDRDRKEKVVGVITRNSVVQTYNKRIFQEDLSGGFSSIVDTIDGDRTIEVLGGVHLGEIDVHTNWIGKNLKETDVRRKFGLEVVLIHRFSEEKKGKNESRPGLFPSPDLRLEVGDRLLVMGSPEAIFNARY